MLPSVVPSRAPSDPRRTLLSSAGVGLLAAGIAFAGVLATTPPAARAADDSAVTITAADYDPDAANAPFPNLAVTVSQTKDLVLQGIQLTWTGGTQSSAPSNQTGGENFLQVMQCGGDDPADPSRPDRTTCIYGGINTAGSTRSDPRVAETVAPEDRAYTTDDPAFPLTAIPFRSATGDRLDLVQDGKQVTGVDLSNNQFFTKYTTNEVPWAGSGGDGTGRVNFEVQTATEAPGLGCGSAPVGATTGQSCWLVIIPRGTADNGEAAITKSGLFWDSWKHHLAVKLEFKPVGQRCAIGSPERQVAGSELASVALASWQPRLCATAGGSVYTALTGPEEDASEGANGTAPAPLALTSRALADRTDFVGVDQLRYAPIALSGVSIAFAIDREPSADGTVPDEVVSRSRLPFTSLKLTPRLIAKLLTNSYRDSLPYAADRSHLGTNPRTITFDPDFQAVNDPEWAYQAIVSPSVADLLVPQGRLDAAHALWSYVLADADATAFLAGAADPWGMTVNPNAQVTGPLDTIPKADPIEVHDPTGAVGDLNLVTWRPYVNSLDQAAYLTLRGDGQIIGGWDPLPASGVPRYTRSDRALPGQQRVLAMTDTASAAKYQIIEAQLLNPAGAYVAPTTESLTAGAAAMTASAKQPQVYGFDFTSTAAKAAPTAYPLTMPVYAALNPAMTDDTLRTAYAALIAYAIGDGQQPGTAIGELPEGYAPLPDGWRLQAAAAAVAIAQGDTTIPSTPGTGTGSGFGSGSGGFSGAPVADVSNPTATGEAAGALSGPATPDDPDLDGLGAAVPASALAGLAGMFAVPIIGRIRRRIR